MKIQFNTDTHIHGSDGLAAQVSAAVEQALERFAQHISRVEVNVSDKSGDKNGQRGQRCLMEARLEGRQSAAVTEHAATLEQAVNGAAQKLAHLLESRLGRLHDHRENTSGLLLSGTESASTEQYDTKPWDVSTNSNLANGPENEALYDRFTERASELFAAGQEKSQEAMERAMDVARQQFSAASEFSAEQGEVFKQYMRRDLDQTEQDMRILSQEAKEHLHPARLGAGALSSLARMLDAAGSAIQSLARKTEASLHYTTGEITTAGTLTCVKCAQTVQLKRTSHIPPCPSCSGTEYRKGY